MTEITDEMLDIIEQVKGKRNPNLWDHAVNPHYLEKNRQK